MSGTIRFGDVILLQCETPASGLSGVALEAADGAVFELIRLATSLGLIVVEAAGNNKVPYDLFTNQNNLPKGNFLNRNSPQFSDSGAIMVGACNSLTVHDGMEAAKGRAMAIE